ncbi:MFS transporter [Arthrobacter sp. StoSoilB22]|uniref:MFS transporter n=1 Tax=Arthrobacter sp. StoSoilB22 TaxID=2830996 RepID=UPI001CC7D39A|nr:MFS transporter [Arthrobacter sp. StoSoilB22]BCW62946.1 MFS transporter [Arthrobacter sp. StoSoilB22]
MTVSNSKSTPDTANALRAPAPSRVTARRVLLGSLSGSAIEWFDFFLYATAAALIFDKQFFPTNDPALSLMLSYVTVSLTFFIRPFGGVLFAHIGDRVGRKKTLVITLSLMGGATVVIGLLPTYGQVGVLAPILLLACRVIQGLAIGGEWGGALLLAFENAPARRRGFYGSVPQSGATIGMLLATAAFAVVSQLPMGAFEAWGWRLPFIASIVLVFVGLWIRNGLGETPAFQDAKKAGDVAKLPIAEVLRDHWRSVLVAIGGKAFEVAPFYIFATFVVSYATGTLDFSRSTVLNAITAGAFVSTFAILLSGALSDRFGRRRTFLFGVIATGAFMVPFFLLLDIGMDWAVYVAVIIGLGVVWPPVTATFGTFLSELFPTRVRYTGISLSSQVGSALAGGTAPLIATWMLSAFGGSWTPIAAYLVGLALISIVSALIAPSVTRRETRRLTHRVAGDRSTDATGTRA